jgi:hypothetical protein
MTKEKRNNKQEALRKRENMNFRITTILDSNAQF